MPEFTGILKNMKAEHPRVMLSNERIEELKTLQKTDPTLDKYIKAVLATSNGMLTKAPLQRVLEGPRLLSVSRELILLVENNHPRYAKGFGHDQ